MSESSPEPVTKRVGLRVVVMDNMDILIVGGGLAGLFCATLLARRGRKVTLLERASRLGGRAASPPLGGKPVNLGAHALYLGGPADRLLHELGVTARGWKPRAGDTWLSDGPLLFRSPSSVLSLFATKELALGERLALARVLASLDTNPPPGLDTKRWLDGLRLRGRARRFLEMLVRVTTYSHAPDALPARIAVAQLRASVGPRAQGVLYVDGGWSTFVRQLEVQAREAGVTLRTAHVTRVSPAGDVHTEDGGAWKAAQVVVAVPRGVAQHLVPEIGAARSPAARAACLDLALEQPVARSPVFALDEPFYFSAHTREVAHALVYLAPGEDGTVSRARLERWLDGVVPGWRKSDARFLPDMEVTSALPALDGAPPPAFDRIAFVGDWTSPDHVLLDAVAASAQTACGRIAEQRAA